MIFLADYYSDYSIYAKIQFFQKTDSVRKRRSLNLKITVLIKKINNLNYDLRSFF